MTQSFSAFCKVPKIPLKTFARSFLFRNLKLISFSVKRNRFSVDFPYQKTIIKYTRCQQKCSYITLILVQFLTKQKWQTLNHQKFPLFCPKDHSCSFFENVHTLYVLRIHELPKKITIINEGIGFVLLISLVSCMSNSQSYPLNLFKKNENMVWSGAMGGFCQLFAVDSSYIIDR